MDKEMRKQVIAFLKSEKGGISGIVFEIIMSVIALSLLIMVIYVFRGNMDIIGNSAAKSNKLAKVKADLLVPLDRNVVSGGDVISVIRYYADEDRVNIYVAMSGGQKFSYESIGRTFSIDEYRGIGYSSIEDFKDVQFDAAYEYAGEELIRVNYTEK